MRRSWGPGLVCGAQGWCLQPRAPFPACSPPAWVSRTWSGVSHRVPPPRGYFQELEIRVPSQVDLVTHSSARALVYWALPPAGSLGLLQGQPGHILASCCPLCWTQHITSKCSPPTKCTGPLHPSFLSPKTRSLNFIPPFQPLVSLPWSRPTGPSATHLPPPGLCLAPPS